MSEEFTGTIVSMSINVEMTKGYGFIQPDGTTERAANVWFGCITARAAAPIFVGMRVKYITRRDPMGRKDIVRSMWRLEPKPEPLPEVTTVPEDESDIDRAWREYEKLRG